MHIKHLSTQYYSSVGGGGQLSLAHGMHTTNYFIEKDKFHRTSPREKCLNSKIKIVGS